MAGFLDKSTNLLDMYTTHHSD